jgi:hypothetical protein
MEMENSCICDVWEGKAFKLAVSLHYFCLIKMLLVAIPSLSRIKTHTDKIKEMIKHVKNTHAIEILPTG